MNPPDMMCAEIAHAVWSEWMNYFLNMDETWDEEKLARWGRLANTPFEELTEQEQLSDYEVGEKVIKKVMRKYGCGG